MGDFEGIWVFEVTGDGGGGEEGLVVFESGVLVFEIRVSGEVHLVLFFRSDSL